MSRGRMFLLVGVLILGMPSVGRTDEFTAPPPGGRAREVQRAQSTKWTADVKSESVPDTTNDGLSYETLVNYNFTNIGGVHNFNPQLFLGVDKSWPAGSRWSLGLRSGPSVAGAFSDTSVIVTAQQLTQPGSFNFCVGTYVQYHDKGGDGVQLPIYVGVGIKAFGSQESAALLQDYLRVSIGITLPKVAGVMFGYTVAQHDLSSESKKQFNALFATGSTNLQYVTTILKSYLPLGGTYMVISYSALVGANGRKMPEDAQKLLSIGIGKSFDGPTF